MQQTEQQFLLKGERFHKQCVLPPHDILGSLYRHPEIFYPLFVGEPGRIQKYWQENVDLHEALDMVGLEPWHLIYVERVYFEEYTAFKYVLTPTWFQAKNTVNEYYIFWNGDHVRTHLSVYRCESTEMGQMPSNTSKLWQSCQCFLVLPRHWIAGFCVLFAMRIKPQTRQGKISWMFLLGLLNHSES